MPRNRKQTNGFQSDILTLLPPGRRQEIINEALGEQVRALVTRYQRSTFGALVNALRSHARWNLLQGVHIASVFRPAHAAGGRTSSRPTTGTTRRRGRRGSLTPAFLDRVIAVIQKNPGLRSEQLQKQIDSDRHQVKVALAKLRAERRVKTSGNRRATTYSVA